MSEPPTVAPVLAKVALKSILAELTGARLAHDPELVDLCVVMQHAETIAMQCSGKQAELAATQPLKRRLEAQHRHEAAHAALFHSFVAWAPQRCCAGHGRALAALELYHQRLDAALARGDLADSLVGMQVVLEGIATALLHCFDPFRGRPDRLMEQVRATLLRQEAAHHDLGIRSLEGLIVRPADGERLRRSAHDYAMAGRSLLDACDDLLRRFAVESADYDPARALPGWLR